MQAIQYTLRDIPPDVDAYLRREAKRLGMSLNKLAVEYLSFAAKEQIKEADLVRSTTSPAHWFDTFLDTLHGRPLVDAHTRQQLDEQATEDKARMRREA